MPRTTRMISWRQRREQSRRSGRPAAYRWASVLMLFGVIGLASLFVAFWAVGSAAYATLTDNLPEYGQLSQIDLEATTSGTQILAWTDADQQNTILIDEIIDPLNGERRWLPLAAIPQSLIDATIVMEEPRFWTAEFSLWSVGRAMVADGAGETAALPIVQQAVRDNLLSSGRNGTRRQLEELLLTHRAAASYSREQILAWYLNSRYYGNLAFGAEAAARVYFDKAVGDLTLAEAAMLAISSVVVNPIDAPDEAKLRQETVLAALADAGSISQDAWQTARTTPLAVADGPVDRSGVIAPHFARYVRQDLEQRLGAKQLLTGGLRVYTSLNLALQGQAECVARAHVNRLSGQVGPALPADELVGCAALDILQQPDMAVLGIDQRVNNTAVIVLDAKTAEIRAMVGSANYWDERIDGAFNVAVAGRRQPGAVFTPFTYLTALSQGYTAATMVLDVATDLSSSTGESYQPQNEDGRFHGPLRLREALGSGYHVPAVQVASWVGMDKVVGTARSLGLTTFEPGLNRYPLSLNVGGGEATLLEMTYAYAVLANMGVMVGQEDLVADRPLDPVAVVRVEDQAGHILYDYYQQVGQRDILSPQLAYLMNDMLSDRSARCPAFGCPNVMELPANRPAAVKTGSTNDFRDAWAIGYTPQLVTGVWVGNSDNRNMAGVTGVTGAAPIWQAIMVWALRDEPVALWSQPPGLVETAVCDISGLLATEVCPTVTELFIQGTQPTVLDTIYREFAVNRETGRLATISTPPELVENRLYTIYPEAASAWAEENGVERPPTEFDTIGLTGLGSQNAAITAPRPLDVISGTITIRGTAGGDAFAYYRLAYFAGLNPADLQAITAEERGLKEDEPLGIWDTTGLNGLYTLLLTMVRQDGSFEEVSIPLTIEN